MKILVLIIASDDHPHYVSLQEKWKKYMNTVENIKCLFLKASIDFRENYISDDTVYIRTREVLIPGVLIKTLKAFEMLYKDYDYIYRTNLSSFLDLKKIYKLCQETRRDKVYAGIRGYYYLDPRISFIAGAGFLLSQDMVALLLSQKELLDYNLIDDVSIGKALFSENFMVDTFSRRYDILNSNRVISETDIHDNFHYRIKLSSSNEERLEELNYHDKLISLIYKV